MRKLSLNVETLNVQSFDTTQAREETRGTVLGQQQGNTRGHQNTCDTSIADACVTGLCTYDCA